MIEPSPFTLKVIDTIRKIPRGKVATYKQIAELSGKPHGARGVVWILHACSKKYKLPWHRVINSRGRIGFDPRASNFVRQKRRLLHEGVEVEFNGTIDMIQYQWQKKTRSKRRMA